MDAQLAAEAIGVAGAAGLAYGAFQYASLWPTSQLFGHTLIAPRKPDELALTFDDGPNPAWTPQLLDILARHRARATFFMVGKWVKAEPELARRVLAAGHTIGNHSWSHPNLARTSAGRVREELRRTSDQLAQTLGAEVKLFRPPYGARRPAVLSIARELGLEPVTWNAMTSDWSNPSADSIAAALMHKIEANVKHGMASNIVLHDGHHRTLGANREPSVNAARKILERYALTRLFVPLDYWLLD